MCTLSVQAEKAVKDLLESDQNQLYEQLAMRVKAIEQEPEKSGQFDLDVEYGGAVMGLKDDLLEFGRKIFERWNASAYQIVCGSEAEDTKDRKRLVDSIGISETAMAATLSGMLVSSFGLAPAIAAVLAALVVKRFGRPVYEEFCKAWSANLTS